MSRERIPLRRRRLYSHFNRQTLSTPLQVAWIYLKNKKSVSANENHSGPLPKSEAVPYCFYCRYRAAAMTVDGSNVNSKNANTSKTVNSICFQFGMGTGSIVMVTLIFIS